MTHLYLIRHGEAVSTIKKLGEDISLSSLGVTQAKRLRDRLAATGEIVADVLISSTMLRARQTAEIIAPAFGLPIVFDDEVQEWRPPPTENVSIEEYDQRFGALAFDQKPFFQLVPNAESWVQFMLRACMALNRITQEHEGKTIVIVCHGGIVDASFFFFFGLNTLQFPRAHFDTHNTSITHWYQATYAGFPTSWILERYNDVMHLRDIHSSTRIPWRDISAQPVEGADKPAVPTEAQSE